MMDLSDTLASLQGTPVAIVRRQPGFLSHGRAHEPAPEVFPDNGSVQPGGRTELLQLAGIRADEAITYFTATPLFTAQDPAGAGADRIKWNGDQYEVKTVFPWGAAGQGGYYEVLAGRWRGNDPPPFTGAR